MSHRPMPLNQQIEMAVKRLKDNDVIGLPTETVYGLAGVITSEQALKKIFSIKQRPFFDPLIVHVASIEQAKTCTTEWSVLAQALAEKFWPGPLTLVLPKTNLISDLITAGLPTVGLRWPRHQVAEAIIRSVGQPLAAPSANKFGRTSPTRAEHVRTEFADQVFVVDGDPSEVGIESTILSIEQNQSQSFKLTLLRKGIVTPSEIDQLLETKTLDYQWNLQPLAGMAPGQMKHHYMPEIPLIVIKSDAKDETTIRAEVNQKLLQLPDEIESVRIRKPKGPIQKTTSLILSNDSALAARQLYSSLRTASQTEAQAIFCWIGPEMKGEAWESVLDRLYKAASLIIE